MSLVASPQADAASEAVLHTTVVEPTPIEHPLNWKFRSSLGIAILAGIAVVAALYLARAFFVPLLIGILASYALRPLVDRLKRFYIPRAIGAALVLGVLVASICWATMSLGGDATAMVEKLPEAAHKVRQRVVAAREGGPTAFQKIQEAALEFQVAAAEVAGGKASAKPPAASLATRATEPSVWLRDYMLSQSALLFTVVAQAPIVILLTYFLLASGTHFRRKLVHLVGPSLSQKKDAVKILDEIVVQVQRYLLATLGSNLLVGVVTWLAFKALGVEEAGAWGIAAGILHFIPYLGPVVFAIASGMAAFMQFETALEAITVAGVSLLVSAFIGSVVMTWLQSRFARVNAAVLFIALLFFGWLWGIWGLLLGAPLVAIAKAICDRVESLKPTGELLGQ
jgi:predicted PurR-regulated permease PerM